PVTVPAGAVSGSVVVTVASAPSNPEPFEGETDTVTCPAASAQVIQGGALTTGQTVDLPVTLQPCETVTFALQAVPPDAGAGAGVSFTVFAPHGAVISSQSMVMHGTADVLISPPGGWPWGGPPYRAPRGSEGRPTLMRLTVIQTITSYTITVMKAPRPGYNTGGTGFSNAQRIGPGTTVFGSLIP